VPSRPLAGPPDRPEPPRPKRRRRSTRVLVVVLLLALTGAGAGWLWRQWDLAGRVTGEPSGPPDANFLALQDFARPRPLDDCAPLAPNDRQLARRTCTADGTVTTYSLYKKTPVDERAAERERVAHLHATSTAELRRGTGISPNGRRGEYIEYTYLAGDDDKSYVAIWWDDGIDNRGGSAVMTMRMPWDGTDSDPARTLRERWLSWGYRLTG